MAGLQIVKADLRDAATLTAELMEGVGAVVCSTGTTAFPSTRCDGYADVWLVPGLLL